jgi:hypothetical protein
VTRLAGQPFIYLVGSLAELERRPGKAPIAELRRLPSGTLFALQTPVQIGDLQGTLYPLQRGGQGVAQEGDRLITAGLLNLRHGAPVQLARQAKKPGIR